VKVKLYFECQGKTKKVVYSDSDLEGGNRIEAFLQELEQALQSDDTRQIELTSPYHDLHHLPVLNLEVTPDTVKVGTLTLDRQSFDFPDFSETVHEAKADSDLILKSSIRNS
jgi:hypothetical protein